MRPELQAYLDGELELEQLPPELRVEAERWDRLLADLPRVDAVDTPADLETRILRSLPPRRPKPRLSRAVEWAVRPRTVRVSPLAGLAAAAALAFILLWPRGESPAPPPGAASTVYVQFVLEAPGARTVAVAGDFNAWSPEFVLQDVDGDGVWTGRLPLKPGVHQYMFVIDGSRWVSDPEAERYVDDGFGNRNAVLVVAPSASRS